MFICTSIFVHIFYLCYFSSWFDVSPLMFVFDLETIRTVAMCVIHVIVKTEETQKLRMKFVLYCTT